MAGTERDFRYLRDPLFLGAVAVHLANRWLVRPATDAAFFHESLNDLLCIPFWVPPLLFAMRRLGLRRPGPPRTPEILVPLVVWSVMFEVVLPYEGPLVGLTFGDPADVFWYAAGAVVAVVWWRWWYGRRGALLTPGTPSAACPGSPRRSAPP